MRGLKLTIADIYFQYKYGFYFLYGFFSIFYIIILSLLPLDWCKPAAIIMIYSDPSSMGLLFMGAIVLLEKSQRVLNSIVVSPVKAHEYIGAKVMSISIISTIVAILISFFSGIGNVFFVIIGVFLSSILFSIIGIIISFKINSLNQFLIAIVPFQLIFIVPPILLILGVKEVNFILHPGIATIGIINGGTHKLFLLSSIIILWIVCAWRICVSVVNKAFLKLGGVTL